MSLRVHPFVERVLVQRLFAPDFGGPPVLAQRILATHFAGLGPSRILSLRFGLPHP